MPPIIPNKVLVDIDIALVVSCKYWIKKNQWVEINKKQTPARPYKNKCNNNNDPKGFINYN